MTTKLSLTARYLLTYIRFKTNNNRPFFANNATIAKVIGCTEASTKVIINTLIREGYIIKTIDDKKRRNLSLSGKEFQPLDGVYMNNVEKHILKQDAQNQEDWAKYQQKENEAYKARIKTLEADITRLNQQIFELQNQETAKPVLQKPTPQPEYRYRDRSRFLICSFIQSRTEKVLIKICFQELMAHRRKTNL